MEGWKGSKMRRGLFFSFCFSLSKIVNTAPKRGEDPPFFIYLFFCFSLFKMATKFGKFPTGEKTILRQEKNQEKLLGPLRKIFLLRPCSCPVVLSITR